jgi:hypothetical protein
MSAHPKHTLGWLEYEEVGEVRDQEIELLPVQTSGEALRIPLDEAGTESLLLEYRPRTGFDEPLPAGGVLVTRLDRDGLLRPASGLRYHLSVLEADGNAGLVRTALEGGNRGEAGDVFGPPGNRGKLNALSDPPLRLAATGEATSVAIHEVTLSGGRAIVRLSTAPTPALVGPLPLSTSVARSFEKRLRVAGGFMPYRLETGPLPEGLQAAVEEDEVVLAGVLLEEGAVELTFELVDARGSAAPFLVPVTIEEFLVSEARLLQPLLRSPEEPLGEAERGYLDARGNGNGRFDVGDVRAWLLGPPGVNRPPARAP